MSKQLIDIEVFERKLDRLKKYLFDKIDGIEAGDIEAELLSVDTTYQIEKINKPKESVLNSKIIITDHAFDRAKERLSMSRSAFIRISETAYEDGIVQKEVAGSLRRYLDKLYLSHKQAGNIRLYGENVFLFGGNVLITVFQVPPNIRKSALRIQKRIHMAVEPIKTATT